MNLLEIRVERVDLVRAKTISASRHPLKQDLANVIYTVLDVQLILQKLLEVNIPNQKLRRLI